jgi:hypothetical protein
MISVAGSGLYFMTTKEWESKAPPSKTAISFRGGEWVVLEQQDPSSSGVSLPRSAFKF